MPKSTCKHPKGCERPIHRRGWCAMHYARVLTTGEPGQVDSYYVLNVERCQHPGGCDRPSMKRGFCNMHYLRLRRNGDPGPARVINKWDVSWRDNLDRLPKSRIGDLRDSLLAEQDGVCAICEEVDTNGMWCLDHDHKCCPSENGQHRICSKCVRRVLCNKCNTALGYLQDDPELLRKAADYIDAFRV